MSKLDVQKTLKKIARKRMFGEPEVAISLLNQLHQEYPQEKKYLGLLASSYYGLWEFDTAKDYIQEALELDPNYYEMYELLGMMAYLNNNKEEAESYYFKALSINPKAPQIRVRLMDLYYEEEKYEQVIEQGEYVLNQIIPDRMTFDIDKRKDIHFDYSYVLYFSIYKALIQLKRYQKAIHIIEDYKELEKPTIKDPYYFNHEDDLLLKLYYLVGNKEKTEEYRDLWLNHYKVPVSRVVGAEKDAEQGYILDMNRDNYQIDEKGNFY